MRVIETVNPNFRVTRPVRVLFGDGVLMLQEGDGVRLVNQDNKLCVEAKIDGEPVSIIVEDKQAIINLLKCVAHESEFQTVKMPLQKALADEDIPTDQLALMLREIQRKGRELESVEVEKRVKRYKTEEKVKRILNESVELAGESYQAEQVVVE